MTKPTAWARSAERNILGEPFFGGAKLHVVDLKLHMAVRWFIGGKVDHIPATIFAAVRSSCVCTTPCATMLA